MRGCRAGGAVRLDHGRLSIRVRLRSFGSVEGGLKLFMRLRLERVIADRRTDDRLKANRLVGTKRLCC